MAANNFSGTYSCGSRSLDYLPARNSGYRCYFGQSMPAGYVSMEIQSIRLVRYHNDGGKNVTTRSFFSLTNSSHKKPLECNYTILLLILGLLLILASFAIGKWIIDLRFYWFTRLFFLSVCANCSVQYSLWWILSYLRCDRFGYSSRKERSSMRMSMTFHFASTNVNRAIPIMHRFTVPVDRFLTLIHRIYFGSPKSWHLTFDICTLCCSQFCLQCFVYYFAISFTIN